jgi:tetratricopeptide (TPR) repeat protein
MIRHIKTRIRIAYFFWVFWIRPYWGTFSIYAGIALPVWFLLQYVFARLSGGESGTAYWAHVGGFLFGAAVGLAFKYLDLEKKYIAPMVEETFEKLKLSPKMKDANRKLEIGDKAAAILLLLQVVKEEPQNNDAPHTLARLYSEKGQTAEAAAMYNQALACMFVNQDLTAVIALHDELAEKNLLDRLTEKNLFNLGPALEKVGKDDEAINIYATYCALYPAGRVRPKAMARSYLVYRDKLKDPAKAQAAREQLEKEYPEFPISPS